MNEPNRILVVDDDIIVRESIAGLLGGEGYDVVACGSAETALELEREAAARAAPFAAAMVDVSLPGIDGMELLRRWRQSRTGIVPIIMTGYGTIEAAVRAIRDGAIDYLTKPIVDREVLLAVEKAIQQHTLRAQNSNLRSQLNQRYGLGGIVGSDPRMQRLYDLIEAVAPTRTTVLMSGESGTGKSLIARAIHRSSTRADEPFVEISCGSIPESLLESELFGHTKGAFTGAHTDKPGRFLAAHKGTLFLDEINSASPGMQLKLLRVLQDRAFEPVGSNEPVEVDVRVILASNEPLERLVANGSFRQDLYYRINVVMLELPPLRDRVMDITALAEYFVESKANEIGKSVLGFTDEALAALHSYHYPGNVRELENIIERAVVLTRSTRVDLGDLPASVVEPDRGAAPIASDRRTAIDFARPLPLKEALEEPEKQIILAALEANDWNRQRTSEQLDINRTTLYKKIKQYDLEQYGRSA